MAAERAFVLPNPQRPLLQLLVPAPAPLLTVLLIGPPPLLQPFYRRALLPAPLPLLVLILLQVLLLVLGLKQ